MTIDVIISYLSKPNNCNNKSDKHVHDPIMLLIVGFQLYMIGRDQIEIKL